MPEVQSMTLENILLLIVALLCGLLSFECTHLPRSGVYTTINRTMWHLAHIIVTANLNLYIVFTQARASLLLIFIYSLTLDFLLFALYHTINTRAAIKRSKRNISKFTIQESKNFKILRRQEKAKVPLQHDICNMECKLEISS